MLDREHPARRETHRQIVLHLLGAAGIRLSDLAVASFEVSVSVKILTAYLGEPVKGNVLAKRRSPYEADLWHADMGNRECLELAKLVEATLRGLGYEASRSSAVPILVDFTCPATSETTSPALVE